VNMSREHSSANTTRGIGSGFIIIIIIIIICHVDYNGPSLGKIADSNPAGAWMTVC